MSGYMPPGFNTVTPYFFVNDAERFVAFLVQGLCGVETCRTMRANGLIQNVIVQLGTSAVMVSEAAGKYPSMAAAYYLYVKDAETSMRRAIEHGAQLEMAVADMPYGDWQGGVRDAHENIWWISQRTVHQPYSP
jgi:PhnB protein